MKASVKIAREIEKRFPHELLRLLRRAGEVAAAQGQGLYLVGGAVRDLLLGCPNFDLDLVAEGNAIALARRLAGDEGELRTHPRFGTAKLQLGEGSIDFASARRESYPRPGALPEVTPGTIEDDLFRRDFTINAMALRLDRDFGELLDPYGGKRDLKNGLLRVLHQRSFIDDATRILRALRYKQRLGFRLERGTERLLRRDVAMMDTISGDRLRHELELILGEEHPERVLSRAEALGVLQRLHPSLRGDGWLEDIFQKARQEAPGPALYLSLLCYRLTEEEGQSFMGRLRVAGEARRAVGDTLRLKRDLPTLTAPDLAPSALYRLLEKRSPVAVLALALASGSVLAGQRLRLYLDELRHIKPSLNGDALMALGVSPGRRLGQMLRLLHEARLDGKVGTREEEEVLVRRWLAGE